MFLQITLHPFLSWCINVVGQHRYCSWKSPIGNKYFGLDHLINQGFWWCVSKRIYGYKYNSKTPKLRGALRLCFSIVGGHSFCNEVAVKTLRVIDPWFCVV